MPRREILYNKMTPSIILEKFVQTMLIKILKSKKETD